MRPCRSAVLCLLAATFLVGAGCRRQVLDTQTTLSLEAGDIKSVIADPPIRDEKVTVTVNSPGAPVSVYVVLEKDHAALEKALQAEKQPAGALAAKEKTEQATLETTVPAKSEFAVVVYNPGPKAARAQVSLKGR